eukprot:m.150601 g.150601  ORF g.150601 m.150601 type:complete len:63 (-) comp30734_c0_seq1:86-274(-)
MQPYAQSNIVCKPSITAHMPRTTIITIMNNITITTANVTTVSDHHYHVAIVLVTYPFTRDKD